MAIFLLFNANVASSFKCCPSLVSFMIKFCWTSPLRSVKLDAYLITLPMELYQNVVLVTTKFKLVGP